MEEIRRFLPGFTFQFTKVFLVLFAGVAFLAAAVNASAQMAPDIYVSMTNLEFFPTEVEMSDARILKIYNLGNDDLVIQSMLITKDTDSSFSIDYNNVNADPCGSAQPTITPQTNCQIKIIFTPHNVGDHQAGLSIFSNDPDEHETIVNLNGEATGSADISVKPTSIDFGAVTVGEISSKEVITIYNNGTGPLYPYAYLSDYTNFGLDEYGGTNPCGMGAIVNGGSYCTMEVWFKPSTGGIINGKLTISSNDQDEPEIILSLDGEGLIPDIGVEPTAIDFGYVLLGESSSDVEITVSNTDRGVLYPIADLSDGKNFSLDENGGSNPCGPYAVLNGNSECTMSARFEPSSAGIFDETLSITSNDPDEPEVTVTLNSAGCSSFLTTESESFWYEIQDIPKATNKVIILATLINKNSQDLSFSEDTFQLWGYTVDPEADFVDIPGSSIKVVEEPTGTVVQDAEFKYHLEVNLSGLPYMPRLGFRAVTVEGGTMIPGEVPLNESCVININPKGMPWMPLLLDDK